LASLLQLPPSAQQWRWVLHAVPAAGLVFFSLQPEQTTALGSSAAGAVLLVPSPIAFINRASGALHSLQQPDIGHFNPASPDLN
jgi:hypothetical protein